MPGLKVVEEEKVPETDAVEKTIESMINLDGAKLLFPTSFGYFDPHVLKMANKFPKLRSSIAAACGARRIRRTSAAISVTSTRPSTCGIVAGHSTKAEARLRRGQADPASAAQHQRVHARRAAVNPKITTPVIFTGDWSMPVKEADAANSLIDQGVDVLTCHVDSPKVMVENAEKRGPSVRLSHQPGCARAEGLSHRRRVELGRSIRRSSRDAERRTIEHL